MAQPERRRYGVSVAALTTAVLAWSLGEDEVSLSGRQFQALAVLDPEGSHHRA